eukprot:1920185-Alexandrium_andersonii.AAC.1
MHGGSHHGGRRGSADDGVDDDGGGRDGSSGSWRVAPGPGVEVAPRLNMPRPSRAPGVCGTEVDVVIRNMGRAPHGVGGCLLYTSPSPRD